jgi:hypothetical protein
MDFDEPCRSTSTYFIADRAVRRDRAHESDHAIAGQEICDEADSPNILVSILAAETKSPTDLIPRAIRSSHTELAMVLFPAPLRPVSHTMAPPHDSRSRMLTAP